MAKYYSCPTCGYSESNTKILQCRKCGYIGCWKYGVFQGGGCYQGTYCPSCQAKEDGKLLGYID